MADLYAQAVGSELFHTFDWSDQIPATSPLTTISSVDYTFPSLSPTEIAEGVSSDNFPSYLSTVEVTGILHGRTYMIRALATLSNGEVIVKNLIIRGFNG